MRKFLVICALTALVFLTGIETAGAWSVTKSDRSITQDQVIGEAKAIDPATRQVTVRTDTGVLVTIMLDGNADLIRVPPGDKTLEKGVKITLADISEGDRILARGDISSDGKSLSARQLIIISRSAIGQQQERESEEWRRRGIIGRVTALNPGTKEITVLTRSPEGPRPIVIDASSNARFLRYAPDSLRFSDAAPSSFAELKVGDQLRALGERSADGSRFTPEEIISGSFRRVGGTVTAINTTAGEIRIKDEQTGKPLIVVVGKRSTLRRIPPEVTASLSQAAAVTRSSNNMRPARGDARVNNGTGGEESSARAGASGRNFQEMLERLPAITLADLKQGDTILVTSTAGSDPARMTAVTLMTGDAAFLNRMLRPQGQPMRGVQNMSPGLPNTVIGGGDRQP